MAASAPREERPNLVVRVLEKIAAAGNRLPDPLTLFVIMAAMVVVASALFAGASAEVRQPSGELSTQTVQSLLSWEGIRWMFLSAIDNFMGFAPLGPVLTVMIGIGVAERTGFITMGLRVLVASVPRSMITATLVFACVMSSMVADAGYVVLTPLGALLFAGLGRHPIAGLAAAYAGVSGGFSANLLITGLDPMLARLTGQAAETLDPTYAVNATANYYFLVVSTLLVTVVCTWVTTKIVEPMLGEWNPSQASDEYSGDEQAEEPGAEERRAFFIALGVGAVVAAGIAFLGIWSGSPLRDPVEPGGLPVDALHSYFEAVEVLIALLFIFPGIVYGVVMKSIKSDKDVAKMASDTMGTMGAYVVLAFVAGQFVAYFNWTSLGAITAVRGAEGLEAIGLTGMPLLLAFLGVSAAMNLFVGSASAKWAFMAPIFVPMMMMMGFSPEVVQAAYRVGDSITNIITPLMPYLPIIIVFAQRYVKDIKIGTILTTMLPYSVALGITWTILLIVWVQFGLPLGPGVSATYAMPGG
ncbi:AbgT family transporter [Lujinxingia vulgaris]|uniref:AbgT family transporter n=1 Tax=Lujinxingia vulgaris TaxID=2600176 RepID=A0A5C6X863_9DELT|nr:AbgT family transporter [Lujinxingia vulgaris]TXD35930.1 AbgT family transporter [Lujinxingia vulgaris]